MTVKIKPRLKDNKILLKSISTNETHQVQYTEGQVQYTEGQVVSNPTDISITPEMFKDSRVAPKHQYQHPVVDIISNRG